MGCLSTCRFSNWAQEEPDFTNGKKADPRSFCIQKTLQDIGHDDAMASRRSTTISCSRATMPSVLRAIRSTRTATFRA